MPTDATIFAPLPAIEAALEDAVRAATATPRLRDAIAYATLGAGKRIRPLLAWHCCEAVGGTGSDALPACTAIELVHCFSLVHDDLPALDNDALRRGKPTVHVQFGEAMAILAGDALLTLAPQAILRGWPEGGGHAQRVKLTLVSVLSGATSAMIAGQVADTMHDFDASLPGADARLHFIHENKTGALLEAACMMGAHCASIRGGTVPGASFDTVHRYARVLGLLFQAVDDLLDVTQSADRTGKRTQKDAEAGKLTFPGVYGVDRTRAMIAEYQEQAVAALAPLGPRADALARIAEVVATRTH
ncbi:MAG TPA: polyprenyl synthetase family protein [Phycisphaerales bacterium]|nr:polyprenyl synthetase family protein [Phycisphaerales bacterium]